MDVKYQFKSSRHEWRLEDGTLVAFIDDRCLASVNWDTALCMFTEKLEHMNGLNKHTVYLQVMLNSPAISSRIKNTTDTDYTKE